MNGAKNITLREVGTSSSNYNTSSLGTKFIIDGAPISTDANMQRLLTDPNTTFDAYNAVNAGVDMRNISTSKAWKSSAVFLPWNTTT